MTVEIDVIVKVKVLDWHSKKSRAAKEKVRNPISQCDVVRVFEWLCIRYLSRRKLVRETFTENGAISEILSYIVDPDVRAHHRRFHVCLSIDGGSPAVDSHEKEKGEADHDHRTRCYSPRQYAL